MMIIISLASAFGIFVSFQFQQQNMTIPQLTSGCIIIPESWLFKNDDAALTTFHCI